MEVGTLQVLKRIEVLKCFLIRHKALVFLLRRAYQLKYDGQLVVH